MYLKDWVGTEELRRKERRIKEKKEKKIKELCPECGKEEHW